MQEFIIGLKAKIYSIKQFSGIEYKKAKGVKKNIIKNEIQHEPFNKFLFDNTKIMSNNGSIRIYIYLLSSRTNSRFLVLMTKDIYWQRVC